eukprot:Gb_32816 [translate_table: standard]
MSGIDDKVSTKDELQCFRNSTVQGRLAKIEAVLLSSSVTTKMWDPWTYVKY